MNVRTIATLAVALCLGLLAVVLVRGYLVSGSKQSTPIRSTGSTVAVVVAASPIARGVVLQPGLLKVVNYPGSSVPAGSFQAVAQLVGAGPTARVALRGMAADEPVLTNTVSLPGAKATLSEVLTPGFRAVSLRSNEIAGVGGFVLPGDRVDVLLTRTGSGADQKDAVTQALAENVLVLGVDQSDDAQADKPVVAKAVTIQVTPEQAQAISLGEAVGTLSLSLRHISDEAGLMRKATTVAQLGFGRAPARAVRRLPPGIPYGFRQVRVTRGVTVVDYTISNP
jgi:pilus assembly protein CpaB